MHRTSDLAIAACIRWLTVVLDAANSVSFPFEVFSVFFHEIIHHIYEICQKFSHVFYCLQTGILRQKTSEINDLMFRVEVFQSDLQMNVSAVAEFQTVPE